jgi:type I restriction enzyme M protein
MPEKEQQTFLERAITDGHAKIIGEGKQRKIIYVAVNHTERYDDSEEKVRAEFWAELIYRYGYEPARIGVEITVPDRTPSDRADLVWLSSAMTSARNFTPSSSARRTA